MKMEMMLTFKKIPDEFLETSMNVVQICIYAYLLHFNTQIWIYNIDRKIHHILWAWMNLQYSGNIDCVYASTEMAPFQIFGFLILSKNCFYKNELKIKYLGIRLSKRRKMLDFPWWRQYIFGVFCYLTFINFSKRN